MTQLLGHDEALSQFESAFKVGRLHHAWLITGAEGIGKSTVAHRLAAYALSGGTLNLHTPDPGHSVSKLMKAEAHPDMLVIRRMADEKTGELRKGIVVDDVLKITNFLHKTASHGSWRVVIVEDAHFLNRNGQNALLKMVEEPPANTIIFLTVTSAGILLPTIRSRCRLLPLAPLPHDQLRVLLRRAAPDLSADDENRLLQISSGSIGNALKIIRTEALPLYDQLRGLLWQRAGSLDVTAVQKLAEQVSRKADAEGYEVLVDLLLGEMRQKIREKAKSGTETLQGERDLYRLDKVIALFEAEKYGNLDRKLTLVNVAAQIAAT